MENQTKKPVVVFTIADEKNEPYAEMLKNSFHKFHPYVPFKCVSGDDLKARLAGDPHFFYRATPIIASELIKEYDLVIKIDADSIIAGDLQYVFDTKDYDVATVMNWNKVDPLTYGSVEGWGIRAVEYYNAGFVAMRSENFIKHWRQLCFESRFPLLQYREQDLLNILCWYGLYNVRCLDHGDGPAKHYSWYGLISKSEWIKAKCDGERIYVPVAPDKKFPPRDVDLRVIHWAGGNGAQKMNYRTVFSDEVIERLDYLVKPIN